MVQVSPYARQVRQEFKAWSKLHPNFMTPKVRQIIVVDDRVIEISEGIGFEHEDIFGVSVRKRVGEFDFEIERPNLGELFHNLNEALAYAEELKRKMIERESRESGYMTPGDDPTMPGGGPPVYHGPEERYGG